MNLNSRMQAVQSPVIPIVGELIRNNPGTISLGQGIVYYPPPPAATEFLTKFLADPANHSYKAVEGIPPLVTAIVAKLQAFNQIDIDGRCVVVTAGSNMGFINALLAITAVGDEIILQTPYYFNHEMAARMAGCVPVFVATDDNYQLRVDAIAQAITDKTKAIVTISPNNPTGVVYSKAALQQVNQLCRDLKIYHIHDEAYEYFTYNEVEHYSPAADPQSSPYTISLFSLSKAYGFASWRIGYMVVPENLLDPIRKVQDTIVICPPVVSQYAAIGALHAGFEYCKSYIDAIAAVRQIVLETLQPLANLCTLTVADGAFYFFLKVHTHLDAFELTERLIREHRVAVLPGTTFGMDTGCYLRIAYGALQKETAAEGTARLVQGIQAILQ